MKRPLLTILLLIPAATRFATWRTPARRDQAFPWHLNEAAEYVIPFAERLEFDGGHPAVVRDRLPIPHLPY